jgi:hypothetical protein
MMIETYYLHYDRELWRNRTPRGHTWWRQLAARCLPAARYGGWVLADAYGHCITYAEKPGPRLDAAAAQAAAEESIARWVYPDMPRSGWTAIESGRGVELYEIAIVVASDEPPDGTVVESAWSSFRFVRADHLVAPGAPATHRWFTTWTHRDGDQVVSLDGEPWAGVGPPIRDHGPRVGADTSLEERFGPFRLGDPDLHAVVLAGVARQRAHTGRPEKIGYSS